MMNSVISQNVDSLLPLAQEQASSNAAVEEIEAKTINAFTTTTNDEEAIATSEPTEETAVSKEALADAISVVSEFMNQPPRNINFSQAESSGKTIVQIFDADSQELIKQFPSEKIINMAEKISDLHQEILQKSGMIIDDVV